MRSIDHENHQREVYKVRYTYTHIDTLRRRLHNRHNMKNSNNDDSDNEKNELLVNHIIDIIIGRVSSIRFFLLLLILLNSL